MKKIILYSFFFSYLMTAANAQTRQVPDAWNAMTNKLASLKSISYTYKREINNSKNNYYDTLTGKCYLLFNYEDKQTVSQFRMESKDRILIYNGTEYFGLSKASKTYSLTEQASQKSFSNHSFFHNSLQTLRYSARQITSNDSILKHQRDTLIGGKTYKLVQLDMFKKSLSYAANYMQFTKDVTIYYKVIIDPATWLPYQVLESNNIDKDGYGTKTVFTDINTNPVKPDEYSWFYSTYQSEYKPEKKEVYDPLIAAGATMPFDWSLPEYTVKESPVFQSDGIRGKLILLDFWIKNCGPCMESFPVLKQLQAKYGGDKFQLVSINAYDKKQEIDFFYKREKPNYKMLYNGAAFAKSLGIYGYPTVVLIDAMGKVLYSHSGFDHAMIESLIKANL
jgi:thiol-disulfide isomerase/thioredoxin